MIAYCPTSNFRCPAEFSPLRCPTTGAPLEYNDIPDFDPSAIATREMGIWRYAAMLPVVAPGQARVTLGEGLDAADSRRMGRTARVLEVSTH